MVIQHSLFFAGVTVVLSILFLLVIDFLLLKVKEMRQSSEQKYSIKET